ncbi:MAG: hypothetical protein AB7D47_13485 [Desulfovibrio sp.]
MARWVKLVDQLNAWHDMVKPFEFYEIVRDERLNFYNRAGVNREWSLKDIPGEDALLYTSIAIAWACSTKQCNILLNCEDKRVYWSTMNLIKSIDKAVFDRLCKHNQNHEQHDNKHINFDLFNEMHREFVSDIDTAFSWATGTYLRQEDIDTYMNNDTPHASEREEVIYPNEKRELGFLRVEQSKRNRAILAAVKLTVDITRSYDLTKSPITRKDFSALSAKAGFHDVPDTSMEIIWKALPEEFRHRGGRPKGKTSK